MCPLLAAFHFAAILVEGYDSATSFISPIISREPVRKLICYLNYIFSFTNQLLLPYLLYFLSGEKFSYLPDHKIQLVGTRSARGHLAACHLLL